MQRVLLPAVVAVATAASTHSTTAVHHLSNPAQCSTSTALLASRRWRSSNFNNTGGSGTDGASSSRSGFISRPTANSASPYQARPQRGGGGGGFGGVGRGPVKDRLPPVPTDLVDPRRRLAVLVDGSNLNLISSGCTTLEQIYKSSALFSTVLPAVLQVGVPVLLRVFAHQLPSVWEPLLAGSHGHGNGGGSPGDDADGAGASEDTGRRAGPISMLPLPSSAGSSSAPAAAADVAQPRIQVEYFRVERFLPIAMQIEADARHIYELRTLNKVEGVCYVCHDVDRAMYISLMQEQRSGSAGLAGLLGHAEGGDDARAGASAKPAAFFNQYVLDEMGMAEELHSDARSKDGS